MEQINQPANQPSLLNENGTQPNKDVVSLNKKFYKEAVANSLLITPEQKETAFGLVRDGIAKDIVEAVEMMRNEDQASPTNDAFVKKD